MIDRMRGDTPLTNWRGAKPSTVTPTHLVMLGTSFETHGGIASVLKTYKAAGLFDRWPITFVATHRDGTPFSKLVRFLAALGAFAVLLLRHGDAVLHVHSASRASFWRKAVFMGFALAARWPVIFHLHGGGFATFYDKECGPLAKAVVRFFLGRAACVVVVSQRWCAWMHRVTRNPRVVCIANPVAMPATVPESREAATIAFAGGYGASKGIFELLTAVAGLVRSQPNLRVECAGVGDAGVAADFARTLGIERNVTFRGWIGGPEREALLARATMFVLPSHAEALPVSVLEAMAAGCPVIASAVGGLPDLIEDGVNGLLVPPGNARALAEAIFRVVRDPPLARQLARRGRDTIARRFSAERALAPLEALYGELGLDSRLRGNDRLDSRLRGNDRSTPKLQELL